MATGIKMDEARLPSLKPLSLVSARRVSNASPYSIPKPGRVAKRIFPAILRGLICAGCKTSVRFTPDYPKNGGKVMVKAFFGLTSSKKSEHEPTCIFNVENAVQHLVAQSREASGDEIFARLPNNRYRLRLHVITEAIADAESRNDLTAEYFSGYQQRNEYRRTAETLEPYIGSAQGIARLYRRVIDPRELAVVENAIEIEYRGENVSWSNFCYDEKRLDALHDRIKKYGPLSHPVALVSTFGPMEVSEGDLRFRRSSQLHVPGHQPIRVRFFAKDGRFLKRARDNARVIAVGRPWIGGGLRAEIPTIRMRIESTSQISTL